MGSRELLRIDDSMVSPDDRAHTIHTGGVINPLCQSDLILN